MKKLDLSKKKYVFLNIEILSILKAVGLLVPLIYYKQSTKQILLLFILADMGLRQGN